MTVKKISTPLNEEVLLALKSGDQVLISGTVYTARDAAHKRMIELLEAGNTLPIDIKGQMIYYAGPSPTPPGRIIGSIGPTTSSRMDAYTPRLIALGLKGMLGKGKRSEEVRQACEKEKAVYFAALGGAAALMAEKVIKAELVTWEDLGAEAIYKLEVLDLPAYVINDCYGGDFYRELAEKNKN